MNIPEFILKWRKAELKERSAAQEHFIDLCNLLEHPTPAAADPTGESFCFEKGAAKYGGAGVPPAQGFADVWKRGFFGWEYKGKHKDLEAAHDQLLRYRNALENPPLLVVCDLARIVVHTNFTGTVSATLDIPLEGLAEPRNIEILRAVFHNPEALRPGRTSTAVTQEAAQHFAEIAAALRQRGLDPAAVAHFLDRIVFCLFAEDTGLLPDMVFSRIVEKSGGDPARFCKILGQLFDTMAAGGDFGLERIRHFNGNLFDDRTVLDLTADEMKRITSAADLDWSAVDPSIFGTLFERGLDPAKRAQLGAHFTSRADIELVVDAVIMPVLRREWDETKATIENLLTTGKKKAPGGAGVPPAISAALVKAPREWHSRGYLPHFDHPGLVQTITFRLADSLPAELAARLAQRQDKTDDPELRMEIETALDHALGACHLRAPRSAQVVQNALLHFDGERYRLLAWVIMPNHVHAMIETSPGFRLDEVVHAWKSFTAKECNRLLGRTGSFWQEDYFDRFIRDGEHFRKAREYIEQNPVKAGLVTRAEEWKYSSAGNPGGAGVPPAFASVSRAQYAAKTPAPPGLKPAQLKKAQGEAGSILHRFLDRLQHVRILDPACGSGNFLYVALLRLKDLEKEAILFGNDNGLGSFLPLVGPSQLYGIEVNPYAHDLAQMTVWIGWLQWIRVNGFGFPSDPILRPLSENIRLMDAILAPETCGQDARAPREEPKEPEWPTVDFIIGNPPFLGDKLMRRELGDAYVDRLRALYDGRIPGQSDLCCYWFEKARAHIAAGKCKRAGMLATQGIRGGANREVLKRIKESGDIFWAESDRPWVLNGANVHVSMVGFGGKGETSGGAGGTPADSENAAKMAAPPGGAILDGKTVATINANLTAAADTVAARRIPANAGISNQGPVKVGKFDIDLATAKQLFGEPNPHDKPNSDVISPLRNGQDITSRPRDFFAVDFFKRSAEDASLYQKPFAYVTEFVKPLREKGKREGRRLRWWQHGETGDAMRVALAGLPRYVATTRVAKHRMFVWLPGNMLPDSALIMFARSDDLFFGVLHSRFHEVWALRMGTRLETRPRYTPSTCFETFPFPGGAGVPPALNATDDAAKRVAPPGFAAIAAAAKELNDLRENWLNPPEWTRTETLEFPGTISGPWNRYIDPVSAPGGASGGAGVPPADSEIAAKMAAPPGVGTVRYPRLVARDAECAARLKERTLTKLYNERPAWLATCHAKLDAAVAAAYGWPADLTDEGILERLLALNQAAAQ